VLVRKLRNAPRFIFGNSYYNIRFNRKEFSRDESPFGLEYGFYLEDSVGKKRSRIGSVEYDYVHEYLVIFEVLERIAGEFDLELEYKKNFHYIWDELGEKYREMFHRIVRSTLDADMWDVAYLYIAFAFRKKGEFEAPPRSTVENPSAVMKYMKEKIQ
jgi:mRNA (guanine-N7-)-methyltransferase